MKVIVTVTEVATVDGDVEIAGDRIDDGDLTTELNEWDAYALEAAVRLSEEGVADEVVTVTVGPESCEETIRQALAKGADRAVRVWDEALEDVPLLWVGAKTALLEAVVREEDPDLVLSGVQAGDDAFAATGVSLADALGFRWAAVVADLSIDAESGVASVGRELEGGVTELVDLDLPAVLTIQSGINEPRYASLRGIRQAQRKELDRRTLADLPLDPAVARDPIRLEEMYVPETESDVTVFEGAPGETAQRLATVLREEGVVQ